jgi:preprotein translocase subunit SecG
MELETILPIIQIIISLLILPAVLLQQNASSIGVLGGGSDDSVTKTRRGSEKFLLQATVILGILFAGTALLALFV